jgi:hypothetical protein
MNLHPKLTNGGGRGDLGPKLLVDLVVLLEVFMELTPVRTVCDVADM